MSYAGLIIFLILSMYLAGTGNRSGHSRLYRRVERLLIPWTVWFVIYGVLNIIVHKPIIPMDHGTIAGILSGPRIHLWYVPFIFLCLALFDLVGNYASRVSIAIASAALAIIVLSSTAVWRFESIQLGYPFAQYAHALAGVFIGAFFSNYGLLPKRLGIFLLLGMVVAAVSAIPYEGVGIPYLMGIVAGCILALRIFEKISIIDFSAVSQCTLGIYFLHIILLSVIIKFITVPGILLPTMAFVLSFFIVYFMRQSFPKLAKYWS